MSRWTGTLGHDIRWQLVPNPGSCREETVFENFDAPSRNTEFNSVLSRIMNVGSQVE